MLITLVKVNAGNVACLHEVLCVNAAHVVSMDVRRTLRRQGYGCNEDDDLVVSLVNGKEWTLPYSESVFNQGAFYQWQTYVRQFENKKNGDRFTEVNNVLPAPVD